MKKIKVGLLLIFAIATLAGCGSKDRELHVSYQKGTVSFQEVYGVDKYNNSQEVGTIATAEHITYYFAAELTDAQLKEYVKETNKLLLQLEESAKIEGREYDIYVCNVDYITTVDGNILYTSYSNFGSLEYVRGIAQLIYGNETNYGLLYGYAASFAKEYGFEVETGGLAEALKLRETNPEYLDMNYACFNDHYVEQENIEKLQVIATNYYSYLEKNKKTDLLRDFSDEKHREYFNAFLKANGVERYDNSDLDGIYVYAGGNAAELIWTDHVGTYCLEEGFEPSFLHKFIESDPFNSGYANLRELMLDYQVQRQFLKDHFALYDINMEPIRIVFTESGKYSEGAPGWIPGDATIQVYMPANMQQTYVDRILLQEAHGERWLWLCLMTYYVYYPGDAGGSFFIEAESEFIKELKNNPDQDKEMYELVKKMEEQLGHSLDISNREDCIFYFDALLAEAGVSELPMESKNYVMEQCSFTCYLVDLVGEENAIKAMLSGEAESTFGKSWEELQDEWENYIRTKFTW